MLTYVINTSENRTLDSDKLFELAGYSRIHWMNCRLNEIDQCAKYIFEKQNVLGADDFRIAVLVDFFGFDRVRPPYGRANGYRREKGVDISLYLPYIEVYLLDNLMGYLESRDLRAVDFDVYYVQNSKLERYDFLENSEKQLRQILRGVNLTDEGLPVIDPESGEKFEGEFWPDSGEDEPAETGKTEFADDDEETDKKEDEVSEEEKVDAYGDRKDEPKYNTFELYCTPNLSLTFSLHKYPYGSLEMTFRRFMKAFEERIGESRDISRHYYISNYGGGNARAAFDTLTLSLHLIRMYEREEDSPEEGEIELNHIDADTLKDVLVSAWNKIYQARIVAKGNNSTYFSLKENFTVDYEGLKPREKAGLEIINADHTEQVDAMSPVELYRKVCYYFYRTPEEEAADNRAEFDRLMNEYLAKRDEIKDIEIEAALEDRMRDGSLATTSQFPSEEEYLHLAKEKEKEISGHFENVLSAIYRPMNYKEEKDRADAAYEKYCKVKACMHRSIVGDVIFLILALIVTITPYISFQLSSSFVPFITKFLLGAETMVLFGGLFVLSVIIQIIILSIQLRKAKKALREAYDDCYQKECDSYVQIRHKFNEDLFFIERARYELRQLRFLYEKNLIKDANVRRHREMLEELEDHIGSMLNKLDVEPVLDLEETVATEFDINKPIRSKDNKVYRVFSIETIEKLFGKKGSDRP